MTEETQVQDEEKQPKRGRPRGSHHKRYKNLSKVKLHTHRGSIFPGQSGMLTEEEAEIFKDRVREA